MNLSINVAEARFSKEELHIIRKDFDRLSKNQVIGKRKLLEYFKVGEIENTPLAATIFAMIKNDNQEKVLIDWQKFINIIAILSKGARMEKLQLIYRLFEKSPSSRITRIELKYAIGSIMLSMMYVKFEDPEIEKLKQFISKMGDFQIEQTIEVYVDEILSRYCQGQSGVSDDMSFIEWTNWVTDLNGINEILDYKHSLQKEKKSVKNRLTQRLMSFDYNPDEYDDEDEEGNNQDIIVTRKTDKLKVILEQ